MLADWIKQGVSSGGTGNLTLGSADASFVTINTEVPVGVPFTYQIVDGNDRERGRGHLSSSTTMVRDLIIKSLISGTLGTTALNVTTAAKITIAACAENVVEAMTNPCGSSASSRRVILNPNATAPLSWGTQALSANIIYGVPAYWPGGPAIGHLYADITTVAAAGKLIKLALAAVNSDWTACPVVVAGGNAAADATGLVTSVVSTPVNLPAGWYVGMMMSNGTPTVRASKIVGQQDNFGWDATVPIYKYVMRWLAQTFGSWPSTVNFSTASTALSSGYDACPSLWAGE